MGNGQSNQDSYIQRINRVIDHIDQHLADDLTLSELADVAAFSKFHFNRIFHSMTGETLFGFIQRQRLQKAAYLICIHHEREITDIAMACGFSNPSAFTRSFREYFNMTPTAWRRKKPAQDGGPQASPMGRKELLCFDVEYHPGFQKWLTGKGTESRTVEVRLMEDMTLAYVRHTGPYKGDAELFSRLFGTLCTWTGPRNLIVTGVTPFLVLYHEYPDITPDEQLRISVSLPVPENTSADKTIGIMKFSPGICAITRFELAPGEYQGAWNWVFEQWLPQSGYTPTEAPAFELYPPSPPLASVKTVVDICVPVKPL
ncbi:MAG: AraC family transcriptional regulator [Spirochaetaceae bacterium]|nr:MAG: AraC family transcriptional regulator [Spirochaetaceae bacterium]